jgi:hypothetical protein
MVRPFAITAASNASECCSQNIAAFLHGDQAIGIGDVIASRLTFR